MGTVAIRKIRSRMIDQTYVVKLKVPGHFIQHVTAARVEVHGDHLVFFNARGKLAALFMIAIVQSWNLAEG